VIETLTYRFLGDNICGLQKKMIFTSILQSNDDKHLTEHEFQIHRKALTPGDSV
jgi:hypothetical protein